MESKYITTPIYYVNDSPHVGHAVTTVAADVLVRFWRLKGETAYFLTGTDEHGAKLAEAAENVGITPQELVDKYSAEFQKAWDAINIRPDGFIRTTNPKHEQFVQNFLQKLYDSDHIYKGEYTGWYCTGCEEFKTGAQIGEGNTCPLHKTPLKEVSETAYLFRITNYESRIKELIRSDELKIRPESRKNEVLGFLEQGLHDIAISRKNVAWGIPLSWDNEHTVYVWVDALLNYLSASKGDVLEKSAPWPPTVQLIAKDILRFHAVIWPALLLAAGEQLPKELFAHGYFTIDGQKMSKSLGNVITPGQLINRYGVDGARYLLLAAVPFGTDGDISFERLDDIYNADLANNLGNLVNRAQVMIEKYSNGVVPSGRIVEGYGWNVSKIIDFEGFDAESINPTLGNLSARYRILNQLIEETKPWVLYKAGDQENLNNVLFTLATQLVSVGFLLHPFCPGSAKAILSIFDTSIDQIDYATLGESSHVAGVTIKPIQPLFPRLNP